MQLNSIGSGMTNKFEPDNPKSRINRLVWPLGGICDAAI